MLRSDTEMDNDMDALGSAVVDLAEERGIDLIGMVLIAKNGEYAATKIGKRIPEDAFVMLVEDAIHSDDDWQDAKYGKDKKDA